MKKKRKFNVMELGTLRASQLLGVTDRHVRGMCESKELVARQHRPGTSWRILMPTEEYDRLVEIENLKKK